MSVYFSAWYMVVLTSTLVTDLNPPFNHSATPATSNLTTVPANQSTVPSSIPALLQTSLNLSSNSSSTPQSYLSQGSISSSSSSNSSSSRSRSEGNTAQLQQQQQHQSLHKEHIKFTEKIWIFDKLTGWFRYYYILRTDWCQYSKCEYNFNKFVYIVQTWIIYFALCTLS